MKARTTVLFSALVFAPSFIGCGGQQSPSSYHLVEMSEVPPDLQSLFQSEHPTADRTHVARYEYPDGAAYEMIYVEGGIRHKSRYYKANKSDHWEAQRME